MVMTREVKWICYTYRDDVFMLHSVSHASIVETWTDEYKTNNFLEINSYQIKTTRFKHKTHPNLELWFGTGRFDP